MRQKGDETETCKGFPNQKSLCTRESSQNMCSANQREYNNKPRGTNISHSVGQKCCQKKVVFYVSAHIELGDELTCKISAFLEGPLITNDYPLSILSISPERLYISTSFFAYKGMCLSALYFKHNSCIKFKISPSTEKDKKSKRPTSLFPTHGSRIGSSEWYDNQGNNGQTPNPLAQSESLNKTA